MNYHVEVVLLIWYCCEAVVPTKLDCELCRLLLFEWKSSGCYGSSSVVFC